MDTIKNIIPIFQEIFLDFSQVFSSYAHQVCITLNTQYKSYLKLVIEMTTSAKTYFYTHKQPWITLLKKYFTLYIQLLAEIYQETQEAVETDRVPLFFIAAIILILVSGTSLFFFALLM